MTLDLFLSAAKANYIMDNKRIFEVKFVKIVEGIVQIELAFPEVALNIVAQELFYLGEDFMLNAIKNKLYENDLPE